MTTNKNAQSGNSNAQAVQTKTTVLFEDFDDNSLSEQLESEKKGSSLGFFKPTLKEGKTSKSIRLRFLPNYHGNVKHDFNYQKTETHFIKIDGELSGSYDCQKGVDGATKCPLCVVRWKLFNSKDAIMKDRSDTLKTSSAYYAFVLVLENEDEPETVGTVQILKYTFQIAEKIEKKNSGELGVKCNPFNPALGADFIFLMSKNKGGYPSYVNSYFEAPSKLDLTKYPTIQEQMNALPSLSSFAAKKWTEEQSKNVDEIIRLVMGTPAGFTNAVNAAQASIASANKSDTITLPAEGEGEDDTDKFFNINKE
jgi:hypothetical protein